MDKLIAAIDQGVMADSNRAAMNNRPELVLLLNIARVELLPPQKSALDDLLAQPLDLDYLLSLAYRHSL